MRHNGIDADQLQGWVDTVRKYPVSLANSGAHPAFRQASSVIVAVHQLHRAH